MTKVLKQSGQRDDLNKLGYKTQIRKWPTYTTSYLNIVSNTGHATRASTIGSLKDLWNILKDELKEEGRIPTWKDWFYHLDDHEWMHSKGFKSGSEMIEIATEKMYNQFVKQDDVFWIERKFPGEDPKNVCRQYVNELIYHKTALGYGFEEQAGLLVAAEYRYAFRSSNSTEEKQNFDGFLVDDKGDDAVPMQFKPASYFSQGRFHVEYDQTVILIIMYEKKKEAYKITILNDELMEDK